MDTFADYTRRQALVTSSGNRLKHVRDLEVPDLSPGALLCRVSSVGLNPGDVKSSEYAASTGSIGGFDFAGEVMRTGSAVKRFQAGDRVAGFAYGYNPDDTSSGAFTDIILTTEKFVFKLPRGWTFEQGSTLGTVMYTVGYALSHYLNIPLSDEAPEANENRVGEYILVSGGATATGMMAVQLLRLAGFQPVATCSPASADAVLSLGAASTFDYESPTCGANIRSFTGDTVTRVLDCVTSATTMSMCYAAVSTRGGRYVGLDPISPHVKYTRRDVSADWVMALALFGQPVRLAGVYGRSARPELPELGQRISSMTETLIAEGKLRGPPFQARAGGLTAVMEGIEDLRRGGTVRGKLVYTLQ
ncbi:GroES-like protein [Xylariaceae sp. FL0016]|nr:GroES-like protein [Xylariaceae sp. FL0016]